jgi:hypothetical protein
MQSKALFDCFIFNDELDLLELRLEESASLVDVFVLVEADRTFSGAEKPLHYMLNRTRFSKWHDKLRHIVVKDLPPPSAGRWAAEIHQRNAVTQGLDGAQHEDVVLVSDADEIVHPEVLMTLRRTCSSLTGLELRRTFRFANWELPPARYAWAVRAMPCGELHDPHRQRNHVAPTRVISDAGRHFTTLGDIDSLVAKFESYSHSEMDNSHQKAGGYLARAQEMGVDVFSRQPVSVIKPSGLCGIQKAFLKMRPDLFDFGDLPPRHLREEFRWYATWRARQPTTSPVVPELDRAYNSQRARIRVKAIAGRELARHWTWTLPRRGVKIAKERLEPTRT